MLLRRFSPFTRCLLSAGPSRPISTTLAEMAAPSSARLLPQLTADELKVTARASERLKQILADGEKLRVEVDGGGCSGFEYKMRLDKTLQDDDRVMKIADGAEVVVDQLSLGYLRGATLDYVEDLMKASFRIVDNPIAQKGCSCGSSFALKMD
ncbi:unnamed protein product, partial [Mesorhabditis spiculigera]